MPEYYIKPANATEAQGPFTANDLKTMAEDKKIDPQTPHFYDDLIGWQPIKDNQLLFQALFGDAKLKLSLKKSAALTQSSVAPKTEGVTVESMLQTAHGGSKATAGQTRSQRWADHVSAVSMPLLALLNLAMGVFLLMAHWSALVSFSQTFDWQMIMFSPGILLGAAVFLVGVFLLLSVAAVYPGARYLGLSVAGYLAVLAWGFLYEGIQAGWLYLAAGVAYGIGVYVATLTVNIYAFSLAMLLSIAGFCGYAYLVLLG